MSAASNANLAAAKAQADALGLRGKDRHDFLADYIAPSPSNWHKRARAQAHAKAASHDFWSQCRAFAPRLLRFLARFFAPAKRKLDDKTAALYRLNLDRLVREAYEHRPGTRAYAELVEMERAKRKIEKARIKKQLAEVQARKEATT